MSPAAAPGMQQRLPRTTQPGKGAGGKASYKSSPSDSGNSYYLPWQANWRNAQLGHQATACSSMVAKIVGSSEKPSSARSSPSRCKEMASLMLAANSSSVNAWVTTGKSRHSATYCCSPRKIRTWIVRFICSRPPPHFTTGESRGLCMAPIRAATVTERSLKSSKAQSVSQTEQRVVVLIPRMPGDLLHRTRPGIRQFPRRLEVAKQHVRDARALGARQPGSYHCVRLIQHAAQDHRPPGEQHHHHRDARGLHVGDGIHVLLSQPQIGAVAVALGVGRLADHHHSEGRSRGARAVL